MTKKKVGNRRSNAFIREHLYVTKVKHFVIVQFHLLVPCTYYSQQILSDLYCTKLNLAQKVTYQF